MFTRIAVIVKRETCFALPSCIADLLAADSGVFSFS
jgi:hypothetical protein